jgi:hypothetical protein
VVLSLGQCTNSHCSCCPKLARRQGDPGVATPTLLAWPQSRWLLLVPGCEGWVGWESICPKTGSIIAQEGSYRLSPRSSSPPLSDSGLQTSDKWIRYREKFIKNMFLILIDVLFFNYWCLFFHSTRLYISYYSQHNITLTKGPENVFLCEHWVAGMFFFI